MDRTIEALKALRIAAVSHYFSPRGFDTPDDRDTCAQCGKDIRNEVHMRANEGSPSDRLAEALREADSALEAAEPEEIEPILFQDGFSGIR